MVIIGVIAALTVPNFIIKHQKEEAVTRLKKSYTTLSQAIRLSEIDNGPTATWDFSLSGEGFFKKYIGKYIQLTKKHGYINLSDFGVDYTTPSGSLASTIGWDLNTSVYRIVLNDGTMFFISNLSNTNYNYRTIYVDINGFKKPNKIGRDLFVFAVHKKHKVVPFGQDFVNNTPSIVDNFGTVANRTILTKSGSNRACNKSSLGFWCAALIMTDNWQIKDDYPW